MSLKSLKNLNKKKYIYIYIKSPQYTFRPCLSYIKIYAYTCNTLTLEAPVTSIPLQ